MDEDIAYLVSKLLNFLHTIIIPSDDFGHVDFILSTYYYVTYVNCTINDIVISIGKEVDDRNGNKTSIASVIKYLIGFNFFFFF